MACGQHGITMKYDWRQAYEDLGRCLIEDVKQLDELIDNEDSCCAARQLRIERRNALLYVMGLHETLSHWDY